MSRIKTFLADLFRQIFHFTKKQLLLMLLGNIILALGLAMFNMTGSNHPLHSMLYAIEAAIGGRISYANLLPLLSLFLLVIELIWGRKFIGFGTFINMFLLGYAVTFFDGCLARLGLPAGRTTELLMLLPATLVVSLGLSVYTAGNMGIAPYDSVPIIVSERCGIRYFLCRIALDGLCLAVTLLLHGKYGFATFVTVFCTGPFVQFFNRILFGKTK